MIPDLGYFFIIFSIAISFFVFLSRISRRVKIYIIILSCIANILALGVLLYLFLVSDLRVITVLMHSSTLMELKYKISACWSSHEASMLFWISISSIMTIFFMINGKGRNFLAYIIGLAVITVMNIYMIIYANPFKYIENAASEGLGMNPSLQDVGMMFHPPLLFISYSVYQIIFSLIIASLFSEEDNSQLLQKYSRYGLSILIIAVGLGGWWAYRELGWGGYWFFDPVENISLIVLLFGISYHHTILQKNMSLSKNLLGIMPFFSAIIGTFLVRSGFLNSVHSFAESNGSFFMLIIATIFALVFIFVVLAKTSEDKEHVKTRKYIFMQSGNVLWTLSIVLIISAIMLPVLSYIFFEEVLEVNEKFYINTVLPIMLLASGLSGLVYFNRSSKKLILMLVLLLPVAIISKYFGASNIIAFGYYVSSLIIVGSLVRFYKRIKEEKLGLPFLSMMVGHISFGVFILAITINNNFSKTKEFILKKGEKANFTDEISLKIYDIKYSSLKNYLREIAQINIYSDGNEIAILKPELRFYPVEKSLSSEVDIFSYLCADWYSVINNIEKDKVSFKIVYQPMISLIWLSLFFCGFATMMRNII